MDTLTLMIIIGSGLGGAICALIGYVIGRRANRQLIKGLAQSNADMADVFRDIGNDDFWRNEYRYPSGMTAADINNELKDFQHIIEQISEVYMHMSGGMISKPMTNASGLKSCFDNHVEQIVKDALEEEKQDSEELKATINAIKHIMFTTEHSEYKEDSVMDLLKATPDKSLDDHDVALIKRVKNTVITHLLSGNGGLISGGAQFISVEACRDGINNTEIKL